MSDSKKSPPHWGAEALALNKEIADEVTWKIAAQKSGDAQDHNIGHAAGKLKELAALSDNKKS